MGAGVLDNKGLAISHSPSGTVQPHPRLPIPLSMTKYQVRHGLTTLQGCHFEGRCFQGLEAIRTGVNRHKRLPL